jgi:hypothetical protein
MAIHDKKTIYTYDHVPIHWLEKSPANHVDKTTLIFGVSSSGKSTIITEILYLCKNYIPNYIVIAPHASSDVYRKKLPDRCIIEDLTKERLQKIWARQCNITQIYNIANDIINLESLFMKANDRNAQIVLKTIKEKAIQSINIVHNDKSLDYGQIKSQVAMIEKTKSNSIKKLYKSIIRENQTKLSKLELTNKESITLEYLDVNPRLMIIIDDCSELFKGWMKLFSKGEANVFESIFFKGRHNYISLVFAAHDDKIVAPELRKNARVTIFTSSSAVICSINKPQSGFSSQEKKDIIKITDKIFSNKNDPNANKYQKLCYIKDDSEPFRYTIANLYEEFKIGCQPLYELIDSMPKKDDNIDENPYIRSLIKNK